MKLTQNIGGETGQAVGEKMRQIGSHHQVFCITHLASVAAKAPTHFLLEKK
jgi:DNA repair protein RecN (Recombination protein N)